MQVLELDMVARVTHLQNLLKVTGMLRGQAFPEDIKVRDRTVASCAERPLQPAASCRLG
jgi:hypothetical protein